MAREVLQAADKDALVISLREAAGVASRDQEGWFVAACGENFVVGKFAPEGAWQVIGYGHRPVVFSSFELAQLYLHEMGIERPRRLMAR